MGPDGYKTICESALLKYADALSYISNKNYLNILTVFEIKYYNGLSG